MKRKKFGPRIPMGNSHTGRKGDHGGASEQPLISVIMPVYNSELYLADAIGSVLGQSHRNLELIIIDGSAHKKCATIASAFPDARVSYFQRPGEGLVSARNFGVEQARGAYLANLDADDIAVPDRLSEQLRYMQDNECQICGSWMKVHGEEQRIIRFPVLDKNIKFSMLFFSPLANPTILGETALFKENPYHFSTAEDYDLWSRLAQRGVVFGNVPTPLVTYRRHPLQTSVVKLEAMLGDSEPIARQFAQYYLPKEQFAALEKLSFGLRPRYSRADAVALCQLSLRLARERDVMESILTTLFPVWLRKVVPMNPAILFDYLKLARQASLPLWTAETLNIGVQSLLSLNKDSQLFRAIRQFVRS